MQEEEWEDVLGDGGVLKRLEEAGTGDLPAKDGKWKVRAAVWSWYETAEGKRRDLQAPSELEPSRQWMVKNPFDEDTPLPGLDEAVASMRAGEKAEFRVASKYAYGKDGGTVKGTKPLRRVPPNTVVHYRVHVLKMRIPKTKRWKISNTERMARATRLKDEGVALFKEEQYHEALKRFRDGSDYSSCVTPDESREFVYNVRVPVCNNAAVCCIKLERWKEGLGHANDALKIDYDNQKSLYLRAKCQAGLEQWALAHDTVVALLKVDPKNANARRLFEECKPHLNTSASHFEFKRVFKTTIYNHDRGWLALASLFSELIYGFIFWSLFPQLGSQVWFFPLEYMDVTGYEVVILCIFAPALLAFPSIQRFSEHQGLHVFAAVGLAVAQSIQQLLPRVLVLALATTASLMCTSARSWLSLRWIGISTFLIMTDRLWNFSRSTVWSNAGWSWVLVLLSVAAFFLKNPEREPSAQRRFSPAVCVSTGSLLFLLHWFALQPTVWSRATGMSVFPLSLVVMLATLAGFLVRFPLGAGQQAIMASLPLVSAASLIVYPTTVAVALFMYSIAALWSPTVGELGLRPHASSWALVMLTWFLHFLASIWTVAYNFVPFGGELMREQTHLHVCVAAGLAGLSSMGFRSPKRDGKLLRQRLMILGIVFLVLFAPVAISRVVQKLQVPSRALQGTRLGASGEIRAMTWAVHFGYDNFGRSSFEEIAHVIRKNEVNVIGLLETDVTRPFTENWDVVDYLETHLGLYSDFGPSTFNNTWGCAILSAFPIEHVERWMLPSPHGELACILDATIRVKTTRVHVIVTHFGNAGDFIDRQQQTNEVAALLQRDQEQSPHIFLGYLTNEPMSVHYLQLLLAGWNDVAPKELRRWCLYIFFKNLDVLEFRRYDTGNTSDTEAQIARFRLQTGERKGKQKVEMEQEEMLLKKLQEIADAEAKSG